MSGLATFALPRSHATTRPRRSGAARRAASLAYRSAERRAPRSAERFDTRALGEPNCTSFPTWRDLVAEHHPAHRCPPTSMIGSANARGPSPAGYRGEAILRDAAKHLHCTMISPHRALGPPLVWTYFLATCLPRNSRISLAISSPFVSRAKWPASSRWYSNVFRSRL